MTRFGQLLKITAVRLTLAYTLLFGVLALGLIYYLSYHTGNLLFGQIQAAAEEEVQELSDIYSQGGASLLIRAIDRRSRNPGAYLYLVSDQNGRIITGNVRDLDPALLTRGGWSAKPFPYKPIAGTDRTNHLAIAQVFLLDGGLRVLVGRDIGEAIGLRRIINRATTLALALMLLTGLVLWFVIGRHALQRIDRLSKSSTRILAGDLSQRLPISGSDDEFDRLSKNLNQMIARVEVLNKGVRNMSDSIAHDLKTPLSRLRNRAEAALHAPRMTKQQREVAFNTIIEDADGLIRTFDALLLISQVSSGARSAELTSMDLAPIVSDIHEMFEPLAEESGCHLITNIGTHEPVLANRELIAQALTNLLDNALKYGIQHEQPEIVIGLKKSGGFVILSVSDNGTGIEQSDRDRVRERFVRLDKSRSKPGTGLGLSLIDAVVKLHNGRLELADNSPGLIAKVMVPLPS